MFYLDLRNSLSIRLRPQLEVDLGLFGARVEGFLSKEITHVVTDRNDTTSSPGVSLSSPSASTSGRKGASSNTPTSRATPALFSRARALLDRSVSKQQEQNTVASDALVVAKQWGIRVTHLQKLLYIIEKEKGKCDPNRKLLTSDQSVKGPRRVRALEGSFLKVEDTSLMYKPSFKTFKTFPAINLFDTTIHHAQSPFHTRQTKAVTTKGVQRVSNQLCRDSKPVSSCRAEAGGYKPQAAEVTPKTTKDTAKNPRVVSGFCESCDTHYRNLKEHIASDRHKDFSSNASNFNALDDVISKLPTFDSLVCRLSTMNVSEESRDVPCSCESHPCKCPVTDVQMDTIDKPVCVSPKQSQNSKVEHLCESLEKLGAETNLIDGKLSEGEKGLKTPENKTCKSAVVCLDDCVQSENKTVTHSEAEMKVLKTERSNVSVSNVSEPGEMVTGRDQDSIVHIPPPIRTTAVASQFTVRDPTEKPKGVNGSSTSGTTPLFELAKPVGDTVQTSTISEHSCKVAYRSGSPSDSVTSARHTQCKQSETNTTSAISPQDPTPATGSQYDTPPSYHNEYDPTYIITDPVGRGVLVQNNTPPLCVAKDDSAAHSNEVNVLSESSLQAVINELDFLNETCLPTSGSGQKSHTSTSGQMQTDSVATDKDVKPKCNAPNNPHGDMFSDISSPGCLSGETILDNPDPRTLNNYTNTGVDHQIQDFNFDISPAQLLSQFAFTCLGPPAAVSSTEPKGTLRDPETGATTCELSGALCLKQATEAPLISSSRPNSCENSGFFQPAFQDDATYGPASPDNCLDVTLTADADPEPNEEDCKHTGNVVHLLTSFDAVTHDVDTHNDDSMLSARSERTHDGQALPFNMESRDEWASNQQYTFTDFRNVDFNRSEDTGAGHTPKSVNPPSSDPVENSIAMNLMEKLQNDFGVSESESEDESDVFIKYTGPPLDSRKSNDVCILDSCVNGLESVSNNSIVCEKERLSIHAPELWLHQKVNLQRGMPVISVPTFTERTLLNSPQGAIGTTYSPNMPVLTREVDSAVGIATDVQPPNLQQQFAWDRPNVDPNMPELRSETTSETSHDRLSPVSNGGPRCQPTVSFNCTAGQDVDCLDMTDLLHKYSTSQSFKSSTVQPLQGMNVKFNDSQIGLKPNDSYAQIDTSFKPSMFNFDRPFADIGNSADSGVSLSTHNSDSKGGFAFNFDDIVNYCQGVQSKRFCESQGPFSSKSSLGPSVDLTVSQNTAPYTPFIATLGNEFARLPSDERHIQSVPSGRPTTLPHLGSTQDLPTVKKFSQDVDSAMDVDVSSPCHSLTPVKLWWTLDENVGLQPRMPVPVTQHTQGYSGNMNQNQEHMVECYDKFSGQQQNNLGRVLDTPSGHPVDSPIHIADPIHKNDEKPIKKLKKKKHSKSIKKEKRKDKTESGQFVTTDEVHELNMEDVKYKRPKSKKKIRSPVNGAEDHTLCTPSRRKVKSTARTPKSSVVPPSGEIWKVTPSRGLKMTLCRVMVTPLGKKFRDSAVCDELSSAKNSKSKTKKHKKKRDHSPSRSDRRRKLDL